MTVNRSDFQRRFKAEPDSGDRFIGMDTDDGSGDPFVTDLAGLAAGLAPIIATDASAISVLDTAGNWTATDVEAVLAELPTKFAPLDSQLFVPAWLFTATSGEAVYDASLRRTPSISVKIDSIITSLVALPSHWATARAYVLWANNTSGSGNVSWYLYNSQFDAGDSITQPTSNGGIATTTAPAQYATAESLAWSPMTVNTKPYMILNVLRSGTSDTFGTGYVEFLGLLIERVS